MRRLREQFPNELVVIGVHSAKFPNEQITENIRQAAQRHGIEHPVVNDAGMKIWNAYAVRAWPTLVLVDPRGRIAGEVSGEITAEEFAENIREVIEQNAAEIDRRPLDLGSGTAAPERPLRYPSRVLVEGGTLFIADSGHHRVIEVALDDDGLSGEVRRVFGTGQAGLRDGPAGQARFHAPHGLGLLGSPQEGRLYVADTENHAVRAVDLQTGQVITAAGTGQKAHGRLALGLPPTEIPLRSPWAVLPLEQYVFIAMAGSHQIWILIDHQQLGPFAGNGAEDLVDGPLGEASFNQPSDLAFGIGHLFVADPEASAVRAVALGETAQVVTLVGQGLFDWGDQDGPTREALLQHPAGLAYADRLLYVADTYNNKIKLLDPIAGQVQTLIGGAAGWQDGPFEQARLFEPEGVQVRERPAGGPLLYIADTNNHLIRVADLDRRQVFTLRLRGLDRLAAARPEEEAVETLPPEAVRPGRVNLSLEAQLPPGYEYNPDAPSRLRVMIDGESMEFPFSNHQDIRWSFDIGANRDVRIDASVYYCRKGQAGLCLIDSRQMILPLRIDSSGKSDVRIAYALPPAGDRP